MPDWQTKTNKFLNLGIQTASPSDLKAPAKYGKLQNVRSRKGGSIVPRGGLDNYASNGEGPQPDEVDIIHTLARMGDVSVEIDVSNVVWDGMRIVVTFTGAHSGANGDLVYIQDVGGATEANGYHIFDVESATSISLRNSIEPAVGYTAGGFGRFTRDVILVGIGRKLGRINSTQGAFVTGIANFDGDPFSVVFHRPEQQGKVWAYVFNAGKAGKMDVDGNTRRVGLVPPRDAAPSSYDDPYAIAPEAAPTAALNGAGNLTGIYEYRYRYRDSTTGAASNFSAASASITASGNAVQVTDIDDSGEPDVDKIDVFRIGGTLFDYTFVGEIANGGGPHTFNDNLADLTIAANDRVSEIEADKPWVVIKNDGTTVGGYPLPRVWGPFDGYLFGCGDPFRPGYVYWTNRYNPDGADRSHNVEVSPGNETLMNGGVYSNRPFVFSTERLHWLWPSSGGLATFEPSPADCGRGLVAPWALAVGPEIYFLSRDGIFATSGGPERNISEDIYDLFPHEGQTAEPKTVNGIVPPLMDQIGNHRFLRLTYVNGLVYFDYRGIDLQFWTLVYDLSQPGWSIDTVSLQNVARPTIHAQLKGERSSTRLAAQDVIVGTFNGSILKLRHGYPDSILRVVNNVTNVISATITPTKNLPGGVGGIGSKVFVEGVKGATGINGLWNVIGGSLSTVIVDNPSPPGVYTGGGTIRFLAPMDGAVWPPAEEFGAPRSQKNFGDMIIDLDPAGIPVNVTTDLDDGATLEGPTVLDDTPGRKSEIVDINGGEGMLARRMRPRIEWVIEEPDDDRDGPELFSWDPSSYPKPDEAIMRCVEWHPFAGDGEDGYVWGVELWIDTYGQDATFNVDADQVSLGISFTVNHNGEMKERFTWPASAFTGKLGRLRITSDVRWRLTRWKWLMDPEPPDVPNFDSNWKGPLAECDVAYVTSLKVEAETHNALKTFVFQSELNGVISTHTAREANTIQHNGRKTKHFSFEPFRAHQVRAYTTGSGKIRVHDLCWTATKEPNYTANWDATFQDFGRPHLIKGVEIYADTGGQDKTVVARLDDVDYGSFTVNHNGRKTIAYPLAVDGAGEYPRASNARLMPSDAEGTFLYRHRWIAEPEPEHISNFNPIWTDGGHPGAKFVQGIKLIHDTQGALKTLKFQKEDGSFLPIRLPSSLITTEIDIFSTFRTHEVVVFDPPTIAHNLRVVGTDANRGWLYQADWVFEPMPDLATLWETQETSHGLKGWQHVKEVWVPSYADPNDPFLVVTTVRVDNADLVGVTTSFTGSAYGDDTGDFLKIRVTLPPNKGRWYRYRFESFGGEGGAPPFGLFLKDAEVHVKEWGAPGPYQIVRPFGDEHFRQGARI